MEYEMSCELTEEALLEYIQRRKHVSFAELTGRFDDTEGDLDYGDIKLNLVYWANVSETLIKTIQALLKSGKIYARNTTPFVYIADGQMLRLPIAKRSNWKYKEPHWMPVILNPISNLKNEPKQIRDEYAQFQLMRQK